MSVSTPNTSFRGINKKLRSKRKFVSITSPEIDSWHESRKPKRYKIKPIKHLESTHGKVKSSEELRSRLDPKFPSFIKSLVKSHVTGGYWMGLPAPFCRKHLPQEDTFITLETQSKKQYKVKYLARKTGLSGAWKEFAVSEKLLVGDVLVFHMLSTTKFKVYIIKENNLADVEGALFILNLDSRGEQSNPDMLTRPSIGNGFAEGDQRSVRPPGNAENNISTEKSVRSSSLSQMCKEAATSSNAMSTFDNFSVVISDLLKDYELPEHIKLSYYELCCSQNGLLHAQLQLMNNIFVGGTIIETVNIANALRECELSTSKDEFTIWDKTINALELLGMNVGFMRARLLCLQEIVHDPEVPTFRKKCSELCFENARAEEEIRSVEAKLAEKKKVHNKCAADIAYLKSKIENHELKFQEQLHAL